MPISIRSAIAGATALMLLGSPAEALSFLQQSKNNPAASASQAARLGTAFERIQNAGKVASVATGESVLLTSQWRNNELLPFRNQRCVVEFLRHFGWVFCWERAVELKRDVLPALRGNGIPLVVVGIGTVESGRTFAERLDFPPELLFVDATEDTAVYESLATRNSQRDRTTGKQIFEGVESMWSSSTTDAIKDRGRDDLNAVVGNPFSPGPYTPLMPSSTEASFVQGASFVFDGSTTLLEHYDESSGAHVPVEELLTAVLKR